MPDSGRDFNQKRPLRGQADPGIQRADKRGSGRCSNPMIDPFDPAACAAEDCYQPHAGQQTTQPTTTASDAKGSSLLAPAHTAVEPPPYDAERKRV